MKLLKTFDGRLQRLQVFAGLEPHGFSRRNVYFRARSGIAADARLSWLYRKDAKAPQLNPIVRFQGVFHAVEDGVDGLLGLRLTDACPFDDLIDKVEFDHRVPPR
jgi:hypothetical protein